MLEEQMSFGAFIAARFGKKWVYAQRSTPRIERQYPGSVVITPKQQRELARDYKAVWGEENNPAHWQMLCALRSAKSLMDFFGPHRARTTYDEVCAAIKAATT